MKTLLTIYRSKNRKFYWRMNRGGKPCGHSPGYTKRATLFKTLRDILRNDFTINDRTANLPAILLLLVLLIPACAHKQPRAARQLALPAPQTITLEWQYPTNAEAFDGLWFQVESSRDLTNWVVRERIPAFEWQTNWTASFPRAGNEFFRVGASNALSQIYTVN